MNVQQQQKYVHCSTDLKKSLQVLSSLSDECRTVTKATANPHTTSTNLDHESTDRLLLPMPFIVIKLEIFYSPTEEQVKLT